MFLLPAAALCSVLVTMAAELIQKPLSVTSRENQRVSFSCGGREGCADDDRWWYQKKEAQTFTCILYIYSNNCGFGNNYYNHPDKDDFTVEKTQNGCELVIQKVKLSHSASYYCSCSKHGTTVNRNPCSLYKNNTHTPHTHTHIHTLNTHTLNTHTHTKHTHTHTKHTHTHKHTLIHTLNRNRERRREESPRRDENRETVNLMNNLQIFSSDSNINITTFCCSVSHRGLSDVWQWQHSVCNR
ncbi:hypothetical protein LDENG_00186730 [Lucifuga dentata]|nr:hypothetical protein LDENG_00186730 [Lucifuga dentata]